jgi:predicted phosphate transport protein (TIGR00153 family)
MKIRILDAPFDQSARSSPQETRMIFKFFPKEFNFFDLFEKQVSHAVEAARFFREVASKGEVTQDMLSKMEEIEHLGDDAAHTIIEQLNKTFITPFDREDIYALAKEIDDVIDMLNTIVSRLRIYHITGVDKNLVEFAAVIELSVHAMARAVAGLRHIKNIQYVFDACVEVNRLENVGDTMRDRVLEELLANEKDPIMVIKWKDIYQDAETVLDVCEDVAQVVDSIMVKQA